MKSIIIISCFLSIPLKSFVQNDSIQYNVKDFFEQLYDSNSIDTNISNEEKTELIKKLCLLQNHCSFCLADSLNIESTFKEYLDEHENDIFFIDLDFDGDYDIIFSGKECPGFSKKIFEIYENKSDTLIRHLKITGMFLNFDFINSTILIYDPPCCAQKTNFILEFKFDNYQLILENVKSLIGANYMGGPFLPSRFEKETNFILSKDNFLRWSPNNIDKDITNSCLNDNTNIICSYPEGAKGKILYENNEGWCFVLMNHHPKAKNPCIYDTHRYSNEIPIEFYGWMKFE